MSGGEVTTIEDAVVRAFNLFNLGKGDRHFATIFTDEKDGALSQQRKEEFFSVKRKALEIGRHEREFFISQTSELQDAADARIVLGSGGVAIR
jgi:exonuclease SbcC